MCVAVGGDVAKRQLLNFNDLSWHCYLELPFLRLMMLLLLLLFLDRRLLLLLILFFPGARLLTSKESVAKSSSLNTARVSSSSSFAGRRRTGGNCPCAKNGTANASLSQRALNDRHSAEERGKINNMETRTRRGFKMRDGRRRVCDADAADGGLEESRAKVSR